MSLRLVEFSTEGGRVAVNPDLVSHVVERYDGMGGILVHLRGTEIPIKVYAASLSEVVGMVVNCG